MNFARSTALLKKINALHDSASAFDGEMSRLERDLILQYLRDLYETVQSDEPTISKSKETKEYRTEPVKIESRPEQKEYVPEPVYREPTPAPVVKVAPAAEPVEQSQPIPSTIPEPMKVPEPTPAKKIDEELLKVFASNDSNDIGSRLGQLPIADLSRAMGINDRILVKNDLFKGDQNVMDQTISYLNGLSSYEAAKEYLLNGVAAEYKWGKGSRRERAATFVKLVKRRYI